MKIVYNIFRNIYTNNITYSKCMKEYITKYKKLHIDVYKKSKI